MSSSWSRQEGQLFCEGVSLEALADRYGTPLFVYSEQQIRDAYAAYLQVLAGSPIDIYYAVKANSNAVILQLLDGLGAGFDVVSQGELERLLRLGIDMRKVIFYGVGKTERELETAVKHGVGYIGIESAAELERLFQITQRIKKPAPVLLRINPDVPPDTHQHITTGGKQNKFGVPLAEVSKLAASIKEDPYVHLEGIGSHLGSQISDAAPFILAARKLRQCYDELAKQGLLLTRISLGGGFGIAYTSQERAFPLADISKILQVFDNWSHRSKVRFAIEPGRSLVAHAGVLLTRVEYIKKTEDKNFAIVDAAMNDLLRPALYGAHHPVRAVKKKEASKDCLEAFDLVGPICESADFLARAMRMNLQASDLLAIEGCGAYAMSMASNYNSRPRAAEALVRGEEHFLIRRRESIDDILRTEIFPQRSARQEL